MTRSRKVGETGHSSSNGRVIVVDEAGVAGVVSDYGSCRSHDEGVVIR